MPDQNLKIYDGALAPWRKGKSPYFLQTIEAIAKHYEFDKNTKWKDLAPHIQQVFLYGSGEEEIQFRYDEGGRVYQVSRVFEGVIPTWNAATARPTATGFARNSSAIRTTAPAAPAAAFRLREEALAVKIAGLHVGEVVQMSIREAFDWCQTVPEQPDQAEERDRPCHPQGNPRTAWVS